MERESGRSQGSRVVGCGFMCRVRRRAEGSSVERERSTRMGEARTWAGHGQVCSSVNGFAESEDDLDLPPGAMRGRRTGRGLPQPLLEGREAGDVGLRFLLLPARALRDDYGVKDGWQGQLGAVMAHMEGLERIRHNGAEGVAAHTCGGMGAVQRVSWRPEA